MLRWLVPITAVATAVVIWVVVPSRQLTVQETPSASRAVLPEPAQEEPAAPQVPRQEAAQQQPARQPPVPESQPRESRETYAPVPSLGNRARESLSAREDSAQLRDELRRSAETDQAKVETTDLSERARAEAPAAPPPAAAAPEVQLGGATASSADTSFRSAAKMAFAPGASISPTDPSALWRVATAGASIERSTDGGQTWAPTPRVPGVAPGSPAVKMKAVRAVDARRAVATTSDGRQFYTTDGGASWTLVQEDQTAPF
jgi:hypothetical protein